MNKQLNGPSSSLVGAPLATTLFRLAVPGVIGAVLFSSVGMVEAFFLKSSAGNGADALAAVAVVFPLIMLAAMFSAGAIGGAVSGRMARAMGAGDQSEACSVLICAILIAVTGGLLMWLLVIWLGPLLYRHATDSVSIYDAARRYASIIFPAMPVFWLVNMLSSVMRGTGDMVRPALVAASLLAAYCFFAWWLIPAADTDLSAAMTAAAIAMVLAYCTALCVAVCFTLHKSQPVRLRLSEYKTTTLVAILRQGLLASSQSIMMIAYALVTTLIFSRFGTEWLAGFGLAVRLELIMVPVIFGVGASLIPIVGAYVGAGQRDRAISIAWRGILTNAALIGIIGLVFTVFPGLWCNVVGSDAAVIGHCQQALRTISPTYMFFALGLGCYFASQGLDTLAIPVFGALLRLLIAASGLYWLSEMSAPQSALYLIAAAIISYGVIVVAGLRLGPWRRTNA